MKSADPLSRALSRCELRPASASSLYRIDCTLSQVLNLISNFSFHSLSPVLTALWERQHQCQLQLAFLQQEERDLRAAAAAVAAAADASPPKLQRPSSVRTRPGEPGVTRQVSNLQSEAPVESLGGAGLSWRGTTLEDLRGLESISKPSEVRSAASTRVDAAGEAVIERTREARVRGGGGVVEGQEKEKPLIQWD